MVQENYIFLTEALEKLGFQNIFNNQLNIAMKLDLPLIELKANDNRKDGLFNFNVQLEKWKNPPVGKEDYYSINRIATGFKPENGDPAKKHTFGLYLQKGFNVNQMRDLMRGHYVHGQFKTDKGETLGRWQFVDFKNKNEDGTHPMKSIYDKNIEFNVTKQLNDLPHIAATQDDKEWMLRALYNGQKVSASLKIKGVKEDVMLLANPRTATIDVYNAKGEKINLTKNTMQVEEIKLDAKAAKLLEKLNKEETLGKGQGQRM